MKTSKAFEASVSDKPYPIPIEMRPLWRLCLILVSICVVSGEKKYLNSRKLNALVWMLIRKSKWEEYEDYLLDKSDRVPLVSIDTATFRALELAVAKGFLEISDDRLSTTILGEELFSVLEENALMSDQIAFLNKLGKKLTDKKTKELIGGFQ